MRRARAWAAGVLVAAARFLVGEERRADEEDEDEGLPPGHPVVVPSPVARQMIREGSEREVPAAPAPVVELAGSLRARRAARRSP